jgi:hypothetical protein
MVHTSYLHCICFLVVCTLDIGPVSCYVSNTRNSFFCGGYISVHYINDELAVNFGEVVAVLTDPKKTRRLTRERVRAALKAKGLEAPRPPTPIQERRDLFAA